MNTWTIKGRRKHSPTISFRSPIRSRRLGGHDPRFFGGFQDFDQQGRPRIITAARRRRLCPNGFGEGQSLYDILPLLRAKYQVGFWTLNNTTTVESFINDRNGVPIYNTQSGRVQIGPYSVTPGGVNPGHGAANHLMQALELRQDTGGVFDFDLSATSFNFLRDFTNNAQSYGPRVNTCRNGL